MVRAIKKLFNHAGFMRYFKNTSWLFAEKILRMTVGLFVSVWVARYLGPERYGLFSYAQSFVGLFAVIATLGLDGIVVREIVKDDSRRDVLLGTAFLLKLIGAVIVFLFLGIAINFTSNDRYTDILIFIVASSVIFRSFNVIDFYFQSKVLSKYVVYANMISLFLSSIVKIVLIINKASLMAFVLVVVFDSFIQAMGLVYFYFHNKLSLRSWKFEKDVAKDLLKYSWPLILSGVAISIYMKIDQVMIKEMLGASEVGQYAVAVRLSEVWYFIPIVIATSLFPAIMNAKKQNEKIYFIRLQNFYNLMVWMAIIIALFMTFSSKLIVNFLYGERYSQSANVLMIHVWGGVSVFFGVASNKWLLIENLQRYRILFDSVGAIFNIVLNLILIPEFGIMGAAIATVVSYFGSFLIIFLLIKKLRKTLVMFFLSILYPFIYIIKSITRKKIDDVTI